MIEAENALKYLRQMTNESEKPKARTGKTKKSKKSRKMERKGSRRTKKGPSIASNSIHLIKAGMSAEMLPDFPTPETPPPKPTTPPPSPPQSTPPSPPQILASELKLPLDELDAQNTLTLIPGDEQSTNALISPRPILEETKDKEGKGKRKQEPRKPPPLRIESPDSKCRSNITTSNSRKSSSTMQQATISRPWLLTAQSPTSPSCSVCSVQTQMSGGSVRSKRNPGPRLHGATTAQSRARRSSPMTRKPFFHRSQYISTVRNSRRYRKGTPPLLSDPPSAVFSTYSTISGNNFDLEDGDTDSDVHLKPGLAPLEVLRALSSASSMASLDTTANVSVRAHVSSRPTSQRSAFGTSSSRFSNKSGTHCVTSRSPKKGKGTYRYGKRRQVSSIGQSMHQVILGATGHKPAIRLAAHGKNGKQSVSPFKLCSLMANTGMTEADLQDISKYIKAGGVLPNLETLKAEKPTEQPITPPPTP
eukprot:CAMPEP_0184500510 /NCGR_PEP_ID=MMETSP0113_2-20130426/45021_1 /TAXON_ID=91329 /ORGANISM="Norrisiella sphaerica, Strain BC52" /LENGTH=475 /DNA_ID=CAMNT_0026888911 /DNA_START=188 /DNA_END=1611 /DNA_ORIENTATION=+